MRIFVFLVLIITSSISHAKSFSGGKGSVGWLSLGAGSVDYEKPDDQIDGNGSVYAGIGIDLPVFGGPFYFAFGAAGNFIHGEMDYNYTGPDLINYTGNDVKFLNSHVNVSAGLKLRLINMKALRIYGEYGVFYANETYSYSASENTSITASGSTYLEEESDITSNGSYIEAGIDIVPGKFGLRIAARKYEVSTSQLKALNNQKTEYSSSVAQLAILNEF